MLLNKQHYSFFHKKLSSLFYIQGSALCVVSGSIIQDRLGYKRSVTNQLNNPSGLK